MDADAVSGKCILLRIPNDGHSTEHCNKKECNISITTGYGRKNSPIWEANKFETKEDMANVLFISGKYTECRFTLTCFEQNINQVAALNIVTLM